MGNKDGMEIYHSLLRRELQDLCRKYGLSPHKTKSELVDSLISYFEASGSKISEGLGCFRYDIRTKAPLTSKKRKKPISIKQEVGTGNILETQYRDLSACLPEDTFVSIMETFSPIPSFEYYVGSEDGINLVVDLDSSRADWYKRVAHEFFMGECVQENKFQSFREELEHLGSCNKLMKTSFLGNSDPAQGVDTGHVEVKSSDSIETCADVIEAFENSEEGKEQLLFYSLNSNEPNELVYGEESSPKTGETKRLDSDVFGTAQEKLSCESDAGFKCSSIGSVGMQLLEVANERKDSSFSPNGDNYFLHLVDTKLNLETANGGLAMASLVNHDACGKNSPTFAEQMERKNHGNEMETSECTSLNKPLGTRSVDPISDDAPKRKRQGCESHNHHAPPIGKILRSSKRLAGEVLPRRSLRLVSK